VRRRSSWGRRLLCLQFEALGGGMRADERNV